MVEMQVYENLFIRASRCIRTCTAFLSAAGREASNFSERTRQAHEYTRLYVVYYKMFAVEAGQKLCACTPYNVDFRRIDAVSSLDFSARMLRD